MKRFLRTGSAFVLVCCLTSDSSALLGQSADDAPEIPTKVIQMDVENWEWIPDQIRVVEGTRVVLKIRSFDSPHRFDLKAYRLKVALPQGKTTRVEFIADKPGEFRWKCGRPCGDGCPKMTGKLYVVKREPPKSTD